MAPSFHRRPHVLAVPLPFQGHIHPLMAICKKLISAGFMVTFANTHANHQRITGQRKERRGEEWDDEEGDGLRMVSLGEDVPVECDNLVDTIVEMFKPGMRGAVARLLRRLKEEQDGVPVTLLAFDFRLCFVLDLAIAAGIPSLSLWTQNAANFACNLLLHRGFQPPPDEASLFICARGVPPLKRSEITGMVIEKQPPPFPVDEYGTLPFRRVNEPTWIVINTFEELEATTLDTVEETLGFHPFPLGPLVNARSFSISKEIRMASFPSHHEWLQGKRSESVLYIAFGTVVDLSEEQLEELVLGLEASKQPFMWVFRANLCVRSQKYTLESLRKKLGRQGLLVPWAPQRDVLLHPAIGGFLTHCGWNSTIEAITMGVPMLTWPRFADQFLNQRCIVEQWFIGLSFDVDAIGLITRLEVEEKVKIMMQGERGKEIRKNAKNLSSVAIGAYEEGGSSHKIFDLLKEKLWSFHQ